jgi:hypothetical protein
VSRVFLQADAMTLVTRPPIIAVTRARDALLRASRHMLDWAAQQLPGLPMPADGDSTVQRSTARLVPQPGQKTSSQGVPASSAARIVGDPRHFPAGSELLVPTLD